MNKREIFDIVKAHLLAQGEKAIHSERRKDGSLIYVCKYRTDSGLTCAIGCLLTDEEYDPFMEDKGIEGLKHNGFLPDRLRPHINLLARLQECHDDRRVEDWEHELNRIERSIDK